MSIKGVVGPEAGTWLVSRSNPPAARSAALVEEGAGLVLTTVITRGLETIGDTLVDALYPDVASSGVRDQVPDAGSPGGRTAGREPVVLVGGFATTAPLLRPMTRWLQGSGYDVTEFVLGAGLDCARHTVEQLDARVRAVAEESGRPVHLIGHSRGGQFARAVAAQNPDQVASLITVGTPFDMFGLHPHTLLAATALAAAGTVGVRGCARWSCLLGECCREFRNLLRRPCPPGVAFTSIYSTTDGVVPARSSIDPAAHNVEVPGRHLGLLTGAHAHPAITEALTAADHALAGR